MSGFGSPEKNASWPRFEFRILRHLKTADQEPLMVRTEVFSDCLDVAMFDTRGGLVVSARVRLARLAARVCEQGGPPYAGSSERETFYECRWTGPAEGPPTGLPERRSST